MFTLLTWGFLMTRSLSCVFIMTSSASISSCFMPRRFMAFCTSLGFIPGNILSPYPDQAVAVSVKKQHNEDDNRAQDYDMAGLEFYLALVFVKIPYQSPHS